jgi:hypothetical protein
MTRVRLVRTLLVSIFLTIFCLGFLCVFLYINDRIPQGVVYHLAALRYYLTKKPKTFDFVPGAFLNGHFLGVMSHNSYDAFRAYAPQDIADEVFATGAISVEFDVWDDGGMLKVCHDGENLAKYHSLSEYLIKANNYRNYNLTQPFTFLIDLKTKDNTLINAIASLRQYNIDMRRVTFVINKNTLMVPENFPHDWHVEGDDFDLPTPRGGPEWLHKISYFSITYSKCDDTKPPAAYIAQAHALGKPIGFWRLTPDAPETWKFLYYSGADILKTDYPAQCVAYIKTLRQKND